MSQRKPKAKAKAKKNIGFRAKNRMEKITLETNAIVMLVRMGKKNCMLLYPDMHTRVTRDTYGLSYCRTTVHKTAPTFPSLTLHVYTHTHRHNFSLLTRISFPFFFVCSFFSAATVLWYRSLYSVRWSYVLCVRAIENVCVF